MVKSILIYENGDADKMQIHDVEVGDPGPGQVSLKHTAIGLNFIDVYTRCGLYPTPLPNAVGPRGGRRDRGGRTQGEGLQEGRPRRLLRRARRLLPGTRDGRRAARARAQGRERRAGRRHHAEGHDDRISRRPMRQAVAQEGRHRPVPCRRRRRRPAVRPMGQGARLQGDRHRVVAREGRARQEERLQVGDRLHQGKRRRAGEGDHQGQGRAASCSTASARTPGRPRSIACSRAG